KYENIVRLIEVGDYSKELCGGTHVSNSGQIGIFKILSESGVAAGVRRIEAVTGYGAYNYLRNTDNLIKGINNILKTNNQNVLSKLENTMDELKAYKKEIEDLKKEVISNSLNEIISHSQVINGIKLITYKFEDTDIKDLRSITDDIKAEADNTVIVFASVNEDKIVFLVCVTDDLLDKNVHAGKLIKEIAATAGGSGGGKADMAQAGGKDPAKVDDALKLAEKLISNITI
ncbi:MAG: alanine--tRNA ligase, partial [Clostridiales bacterium]|nr:alanine--tRNA ligase [Clostridiales bacterium]